MSISGSFCSIARVKAVFAFSLLFLTANNAWAEPGQEAPIPEQVSGLTRYRRFEGTVKPLTLPLPPVST